MSVDGVPEVMEQLLPNEASSPDKSTRYIHYIFIQICLFIIMNYATISNYNKLTSKDNLKNFQKMKYNH